MEKRVVFKNKILPYILVAPQIIITLVFFIWPASQALYQSVLQEDPFGLSSKFVGLENFAALFADDIYLNSLYVTVIFSFAVAVISMSVSLLLAVMADRAIRSATTYKMLIIWPYAVAPVVAAVLWYFLFNPTVGMVSFFLRTVGYEWDHSLNGGQAMLLVIIASAWREISYNFLFFLAGLQAIPKSFIEAAAIDGASPTRRFWTIAFPLLSPTAFFLIVMNIVYAFFDTFGVIHAITEGGPNQATNIMVYKVYSDGFLGLDLGGSAAQSVILMVVVISLTVIQFRYIERRVHY
ncbi:MAG: sn-glycerol-3-phosphate ABC transporter permease UgpA [Deltaproteobacteria bacterium]|jgi:sn-glycerol 3-phosphate transport system permease protein|nr:sn-glycerol-3-phosphate ABC transporter permease UgpA [Deltaproteobacteria bacterium]